MSVRLLFLGRLEDLAGASERTVAAGSLADVLAALGPELAAALQGERIKLALNGALIAHSSGFVLGEGDELAFLPPVSGG
jgi:molybdopterin synthase sulfur carrier subunit